MRDESDEQAEGDDGERCASHRRPQRYDKSAPGHAIGDRREDGRTAAEERSRADQREGLERQEGDDPIDDASAIKKSDHFGPTFLSPLRGARTAG